jgi:hypothetical protein
MLFASFHDCAEARHHNLITGIGNRYFEIHFNRNTSGEVQNEFIALAVHEMP